MCAEVVRWVCTDAGVLCADINCAHVRAGVVLCGRGPAGLFFQNSSQLRALARPSLRCNGKVYNGRPLCAVMVVRWRGALYSTRCYDWALWGSAEVAPQVATHLKLLHKTPSYLPKSRIDLTSDKVYISPDWLSKVPIGCRVPRCRCELWPAGSMDCGE